MIKNYKIHILFFLILILVILFGVKNPDTLTEFFSTQTSNTITGDEKTYLLSTLFKVR